MKNYIITLIAVSVFSGIVHILAPEASGDRLRKQIKLVTSLCILCIAIAPLAGLLRELEGANFDFLSKYTDREELGERYEDIFKDSLRAHTAQSVAEGSEKLLGERFGLDGEDISVRVSVSELDDKFFVDSATVILYRTAIMTDPREISEYIETLLECECEIVYG